MFYNYEFLNSEVTTTLRGSLPHDDAAVTELMTSLWTNFATNGNPATGTGITWTTPSRLFKPYNQYLNISGPQPQMGSSQEIEDRMAFWDQLLEASATTN